MALMSCPDCRGAVSSFAESCPHCGRPRTLECGPCGEALPPFAESCPACGGGARRPRSKQRQSPELIEVIQGLLVLVAMLVFLLVLRL